MTQIMMFELSESPDEWDNFNNRRNKVILRLGELHCKFYSKDPKCVDKYITKDWCQMKTNRLLEIEQLVIKEQHEKPN